MFLVNRFTSTSAARIAIGLACLFMGQWVPATADDPPLSIRSAHSVARETLVIVNSDTIFTTDLDSELVKFHTGIGEKQRAQFDYHKLLNKMVNDHLIIQEAKSLGIDKEDWLVAQMQKIRNDNAIKRYVVDNFKPDLEIGDDAIRAYFMANYPRMQIRTVSVKTELEAENLIAAIKSGKSMDSIARDTSLDTYRFRGGLHSIMHRLDIEETLRNQALKLKPGQLSPPFRYKEVYAFLRLEQSMPADTSELALYKNVIAGILKTEKSDVAWREFILNLVASYPLTTDSAALSNLRRDSSKLYTQDFVKGRDRPVLSIDAPHQISDQEFRTMVSKMAMSGEGLVFDSLLTNARERAHQELALLAAADKGGYQNDPRVTTAYDKSFDSALVEVYLKETIVPRIKFTRAEFETYYSQNPDQFRKSGQVLMDQVTVADSSKAQEISRRTAEGADFEYVAKQFGGEVKVVNADDQIEWISMETFPESIAGEINKLPIGGTSRAFLTTNGWVIFHLKNRRPGELRPLSEVEIDIRKVIFQKKFDDEMDKTLSAMKTNSTIEYNQETITKYFGKE